MSVILPPVLKDGVAALLAKGGRPIIAVAGPPAAGKSTLAETLAAQTGGIAVPMDGFHLDNPILESRGLRSRKGAPETFDVAGFVSLVERIAAGGEVFAPLFDREREIAIAGALEIPADAPLVVLEGNDLLLDRPEWHPLAAHYDLSVMAAPSIEELEQRLMDRWLGLGFSEEKSRAWIENNDLPNIRLVLEGSRPADIRIEA